MKTFHFDLTIQIFDRDLGGISHTNPERKCFDLTVDDREVFQAVDNLSKENECLLMFSQTANTAVYIKALRKNLITQLSHRFIEAMVLPKVEEQLTKMIESRDTFNGYPTP